ncbi:hypothetical protein [Lignipirellula cremea]|uniref:Signal peptide prediction n=1 Tax=Lignipirellula cremea TaxID=2528010 RepID=A0A518E242_9BACT|nr:hypothetical protein [Lignipirellula cremea]QDU98165.1 hypothetical protein Pla8534_60260 [Lignipirellula cremea]
MRYLLLALRFLWASPNTLIGLTIGGLGLCLGAKVRVRGRTLEFYEGGVQWMLQHISYHQNIAAMTLGHVILGQTGLALEFVRQHEGVHVAQFERWGPFMLPAYLLSSVYVWTRRRRFYRDNPFEREAFGDDAPHEHEDHEEQGRTQ